ncbi:hypothetical protein HispidOSU_011963 [Sigmodon hispidus]
MARTRPGPHRGGLKAEPTPTERRPDGRCGPGGGLPSGCHTVFLLSQCVNTPTHPPDQQRLLRVFSSASFVREANRAIVLQVLNWSRVTSAQQTW